MRFLSIIAALSVVSTSALASPVGEWRIADGSANVSIVPCGGNLCGIVSWSQDADTLVGKQVLIGMKPVGTVWSGTAHNARDGQTYTARMSLKGDQVLKVEGCVSGGMICGGQQWSRVR